MKKSVLIIMVLSFWLPTLAQRQFIPFLSQEERLDNTYASGLFSTLEGTYFDMENDLAAIGANTYLNVLDWMRGRVAGLQVYSVQGTLVPFIRNMPAAVYVNEMRMDPSFLGLLPVNDIGYIKVIKSPNAVFWGAPGGVIAIYTKKGDEGEY